MKKGGFRGFVANLFSRSEGTSPPPESDSDTKPLSRTAPLSRPPQKMEKPKLAISPPLNSSPMQKGTRGRARSNTQSPPSSNTPVTSARPDLDEELFSPRRNTIARHVSRPQTPSDDEMLPDLSGILCPAALATLDGSGGDRGRGGRNRSDAFYVLSRPVFSPNGELQISDRRNSFSEQLPQPSKAFHFTFNAPDADIFPQNCTPSPRFNIGFADTIGRRKTMEDAFIIRGNFIDIHFEVPINSVALGVSTTTHGFFRASSARNVKKCMNVRFNLTADLVGIFDGHDGPDAAQFAMDHLPPLIKERLKTHSPSEALKDCFTEVHNMLIEEGVRGGTTATVLLFLMIKACDNDDHDRIHLSNEYRHLRAEFSSEAKGRSVCYIANVGDSRACHVMNSEFSVMTKDHRVIDKKEALLVRQRGGRICTPKVAHVDVPCTPRAPIKPEKDAKTPPLAERWEWTDESEDIPYNARVNGMLALTRALGDKIVADFITSEPEIHKTYFDFDSSGFIVACDGLWDSVSKQEVLSLYKAIPDPLGSAKELRNTAYNHKSIDNITVMIIKPIAQS